MLLAQDPELLLVDEPVAGMTDAETEETAKLLRDIARERSVVVVEHDMHFVRMLGVKVTCLHEGHVLAEGPLDAVSADPRVIEVYLGALAPFRTAGRSVRRVSSAAGASPSLGDAAGIPHVRLLPDDETSLAGPPPPALRKGA